MRAFAFVVQLVQRMQIGLGRGHDDVGIGALPVDDAPVLRQTHGDFALGIGAAGDVVDRIQQQVGTTVDHRFQRLEGGIDRT